MPAFVFQRYATITLPGFGSHLVKHFGRLRLRTLCGYARAVRLPRLVDLPAPLHLPYDPCWLRRLVRVYRAVILRLTTALRRFTTVPD